MVKFIFQGNIKSNFIFSTIKKQEKFELNKNNATIDTNLCYKLSKFKKEYLSNKLDYKKNSIYRKNQISKNISFNTRKKENFLLLNLILYLIILINPILSSFTILIDLKNTFTNPREKIINIKHIKQPDTIELNGNDMELGDFEYDNDGYLYINSGCSYYNSDNNKLKLVWEKIKPDDTSENRRILKGKIFNLKNSISYNSSVLNNLNPPNSIEKNSTNKNNKRRNLPPSNLVEMEEAYSRTRYKRSNRRNRNYS